MTQTLPPDLGTDRLAEILEKLPVAVTVIDLNGACCTTTNTGAGSSIETGIPGRRYP